MEFVLLVRITTRDCGVTSNKQFYVSLSDVGQYQCLLLSWRWNGVELLGADDMDLGRCDEFSQSFRSLHVT